MKTVAAFANGLGGTVLFGVENDGRVLGLGEEWTARTVDRLTNMVSDWVRPLPDFECQTVEVGGRGVIVVEVSPGTGVPYGIGTTDRDIRYYVRRGATTFRATPADVRAFVRARLAVPEAR
jgi:ATP-dependent DNA helicase RecG